MAEPLTSAPDTPADVIYPGETAPASAAEATLLQVLDGDTILVRMADGTEEKVRYIGIDAPEIAHADSAGEYLGDEATAHNAELLALGPLRLQTDVDERDDFGRLLAYVWAGGIFINERMVADGYARAHDYPPNLTRQNQLWYAHDAAREAGIGIWTEPR
jgi:micrococcal nuclease